MVRAACWRLCDGCDVKDSYRSVLCSTRAGVALSSGRDRDDDGKGTRSMRASPKLLLTETVTPGERWLVTAQLAMQICNFLPPLPTSDPHA